MIRGAFFDLYGALLVYSDMPAAWAAWQAELDHCLRATGRLAWSPDELARRCESLFSGEPPPERGSGLIVYERRLRGLGREAGPDLSPADLREIAGRTVVVWQRHIPLDPDAPLSSAIFPPPARSSP